MLLPSRIDQWYAEAVTRVYRPWPAPGRAEIATRQRQEVAELIERARRAACLPPLNPHAAGDLRKHHPPPGPVRSFGGAVQRVDR